MRIASLINFFMRKAFFKGLTCVVSFIIALIIIGSIENKGNTDMTTQMSAASYPIVYINHEGIHINPLHGYSTEMDMTAMRDEITPVGSNRTLSFFIETFNNNITNIAYEVRSIDGTRLIEEGNIESIKAAETSLQADLTLKDLIEDDEEYELILKIDGSLCGTVRYYTRILKRSIDHSGEEVRFVTDFSEKTFDKQAARSITTYMETDETGDNSNYGRVDLHSSFDMITWGDLDIHRISEPQVRMTEFFEQTARFIIDYRVRIGEDEDSPIYRVEEYYRLRVGTQRIYLLEFNRTMDCIYEMKQRTLTANKIEIGIADKMPEIVESEDGGIFTFESEDRLFCYSSGSKRLSMLFSFYDEENADERTYYDKHNIKTLSVDETGNVAFMIYGYMNRGAHEGGMGVLVYLYNSATNTIEEKAYIPYTGSYAMLSSDIERLAYLNTSNDLFIYLNGNVLEIDIESKSCENVIEGLKREDFKTSESNALIVWSKSGDEKDRDLSIMDLRYRTTTEVSAPAGEYIKALGFMEEDLIYGLTRASDVYEDQAGNEIFPMYSVRIYAVENKAETMDYRKDEIYILGVKVRDNQILLDRVRRHTTVSGNYIPEAEDQIVATEADKDQANGVERVVTQSYKNIIQIAAKSNFEIKSMKFLSPLEVMYEGDHEIRPTLDNPEWDSYYVYGAKGIDGIYSDAAKAVAYADETSGTVVNELGQYIWIKSNIADKNQIMKIEEQAADAERSSLAVCLDVMMECASVKRNSQRYLEEGKSALAILRSELRDEEILDLKGCSLEATLYYVDKDIPVLAIMNDRSAVLIVGFNELNIVLMDPSTGTIYKMGRKDATNLFNRNGRVFVTYYPIR